MLILGLKTAKMSTMPVNYVTLERELNVHQLYIDPLSFWLLFVSLFAVPLLS